MSADVRGFRYPLEAIRQRESWCLDALRAELSATSRRLIESEEQYEILERQHRVAAETAGPGAHAAIDPVYARMRLAYLGDMRTRMASAATTVSVLEGALQRIRSACGEQSVKLESLERHRRDFACEVAVRAEREQSKEADRDWLARSQWHVQRTVTTKAWAMNARRIEGSVR